MTQWNEKLENRIFKKSKWLLTTRIIRAIGLFVMAYIVYMLVVHLLLERFHPEREHAYYSQVAIEWTVPNVGGGAG